MFDIDQESIRKLKRCTKCILPETMPFIEFNEAGVCNYCESYKMHSLKGAEPLFTETQKYRDNPNLKSIFTFSGGRDSSFGLHYFVNELKVKPILYTYEWGMETDVVLRNRKIMSEKLGLELIVIQANKEKKIRNINKNLSSWLKKPELGLVPLLMAGDKAFFYYANKLKKEYNAADIILSANPFEKTYFKSGFCGVKPAIFNNSGSNIEHLNPASLLKMIGFYFKNYIANPSYLNISLVDTFLSTLSYYCISHDFLRLFDYISWNEKEVDDTLIGQYGWEKSDDTSTTWRIGDGTSAFYNYIYYYAAGFTENDTLRSNQIREGMLDREIALQLVYTENLPRFTSIEWYTNVVGLDFKETLQQVRKIKQLY